MVIVDILKENANWSSTRVDLKSTTEQVAGYIPCNAIQRRLKQYNTGQCTIYGNIEMYKHKMVNTKLSGKATCGDGGRRGKE